MRRSRHQARTAATRQPVDDATPDPSRHNMWGPRRPQAVDGLWTAVDDPGRGVHKRPAGGGKGFSINMRCPYCASDADRVVDSRPAEDGRAIRRRRQCGACSQRYSTYERVEHAPLAVRKRSGSIQPFDAERIGEGMKKATANLDLDPDAVRIAAARVEAHLRSLGRAEIPTDEIGGHVLEALRSLHQVAYLRFASVHKSFTSADDFARALASLEDAP